MTPTLNSLRGMIHRHLIHSTAISRPQAIHLQRSAPLLAQQLHYPAHPRTSAAPTPHLSNLRNSTTFPAFSSLPPRDTSNNSPVGHWCFLAEIIHLSWFLRLRIDVQDRNSAPVPVYLYTPGRGAVLVNDAEEGHTLAVFYATNHEFADGQLGVRVDDPTSINVLPYSLTELMHANDKICANTCAKCGKPVRKIQLPGQIPYCDKTCRKAREPDRGVLRAVSRLLQRDWESESHAGAVHLQPPSPWGRGNSQFGVTDPDVFREMLGLFPPTYEGPLKDLQADEITAMLARYFREYNT